MLAAFPMLTYIRFPSERATIRVFKLGYVIDLRHRYYVLLDSYDLD